MHHFLYTRDLAMSTLNKNASRFDTSIKIAVERGQVVSQIKGGIEYFDIDIIETYGNTKAPIEELVYDDEADIEYIEVEVIKTNSSKKKAINKKKIAEEPIERFYDYSNRGQALFIFD